VGDVILAGGGSHCRPSELSVDVGTAQPGGQLGGADQAVVAQQELVTAATGVAGEAVHLEASVHQLSGDNDFGDLFPGACVAGDVGIVLEHAGFGGGQWLAHPDRLG
jgi:hypothetical protein